MSSAKPFVHKRRRSIAKAEQILQGATQVFLQSGYEGTSMDAVAAAAGVSKQTLYTYFKDKESLFVALVERVTQQRLQDVFDDHCLVEGEPRVVLRQLTEHALSKIMVDEEYHDFVRLIIAESKRFPALAQIFLQNITQPSLEILSRFLAAHPDLGVTDPEATAQIMLGSLVFFMLTQEVMHGKEISLLESERLVDGLMHLFPEAV